MAGIAMGIGICAMHYVGMAAIEIEPSIQYRPGWVTASFAVAIAASFAALGAAFSTREGRWRRYRTAAGAVGMGVAISGMHYVGMFAAQFPTGARSAGSGVVNKGWLAGSVTMMTLFVMLVLYSSRIIRVTDKLRIGIVAATGAIVLVYLISFVMSMFGASMPYLHDSGPIGIGRALYQQAQWDFRRVLWFTILLNVSLAIFNLLPIPVLDGGQMVFATLARLRGRPLPVNFVVATQSLFMVLFLAMFVYVTVYGDIRRWVRESRTDAATPVKAQPDPQAQPDPAPAK